ncbi:MAG: DUF2150 family protein [Methanocalculus sp. MSAO_Arc1]|nr:DUF2150 family protein [Methanocalculus sp. AMF5]RQD80079.1 MAG: DUF2150 family protein [Methanocalculus sp. MSAO_Arc1]
MARKKSTAKKEEPMKLFYIFYNQERWDNWLTTLSEADFEGSGGDEMPEGFRLLENFSEDITIAVLKIIKLWQNERISHEDAMQKLAEVEEIVLGEVPEGELGEIVGSVQVAMMVVFASCHNFLAGETEADIKALVKEGKKAVDDDPEEALRIAAVIGSAVINGATCCARYVKDTDDPTIFDEWLVAVEKMGEAMKSLKKFDEEPGEA